MSTRGLPAKQFASLPEAWQRQVYGFARFLRPKDADEHCNGLLLSESALARNRITPDAATSASL
jgi:hypothetical protein